MKNLTFAAAAVAIASGLTLGGLALSGEAFSSQGDEHEACAAAASAEAQPMEALLEKLRAEGWQQIEEVELEEGCYEAEGLNAQGQEIEAYFNAATLELVAED